MGQQRRQVDQAGPAAAFMAEACRQGWNPVEARVGDIFQQQNARETLRTESVIAQRGAESVTLTWVEGWAIGPIGWYAGPSGVRHLQIAKRADECLNKPVND